MLIIFLYISILEEARDFFVDRELLARHLVKHLEVFIPDGLGLAIFIVTKPLIKEE